MQRDVAEVATEPGSHGTGGGMVGQGGGDDTRNDRPGFTEAGSQDQGEQLRFVADFGERDDGSGDE